MYFDGARDFMSAFYPIGFQDPTSILDGIKEKQLPKYFPMFEKV